VSLSQHEQMRQAQQNTDNFAPSRGSYPQPPSVPTLPVSSPPVSGNGRSRGLIVNLGKISLFSIFFSVIIMGGLTFVSGFLFGVWFSGPSTIPVAMQADGLQNFQATQPAAPSSPLANNGALQSYAQQVGYATQSAVSNASVPDIPSFLAPLVTATQSAVGQQLGYKTQQLINQRSQAPASTTPHYMPGAPNLPLTQPAPQAPSPQNNPAYSSPTSQPQSQTRFSIQLGVYASKENADTLVSHLQGLNIIAQTVTSKDAEGNTTYFVHSGLYKDYNQALEAASQFASQNIPGATVVNVSQENKSAS
jgi:cell division septation protein DedD